MKNRAPAAARARFLKNRPSKLISIFDSILVPTCFYFGTQNPPISVQKLIPRGIEKMIDFWIDFLAILAPFWEPIWSSSCQKSVRGSVRGKRRYGKNDPRCHPGGPETISRRPKNVNLALFWHPKSTKIRPKIDPKRH